MSILNIFTEFLAKKYGIKIEKGSKPMFPVHGVKGGSVKVKKGGQGSGRKSKNHFSAGNRIKAAIHRYETSMTPFAHQGVVTAFREKEPKSKDQFAGLKHPWD